MHTLVMVGVGNLKSIAAFLNLHVSHGSIQPGFSRGGEKY